MDYKKKKPLPIGISDYKSATTDYYYVDKTLLIRDFLDRKTKVSLFTRPRRFGKTLNMDMLRVFFEKNEEDTSIYFQDKFIWECEDEYKKYQGKYPVIFLSFKDIKCLSWQETMEKMKRLIALEFIRHAELEKSSALNIYEKEKYLQIAYEKGKDVDYEMSLQLLSLFLHKHYQKETIIIIDEYDIPIQQGHMNGFYPEVVGFMRNFFSGGLKDNEHLAYGFLTGILRVAKESIFSGLNNLKINTLLDETYSQYFGFTREEILRMLEYYGHSEKIDEVCEWYNGYLFGKTEIFNPWSFINYIGDNCTPKAFWQSTGSNDIIGEIIQDASIEEIKNLYQLMQGKTIATYIDTNVIYPEVKKNPYSIYSFLLLAGYLRITSVYPQYDGNFMCEVGIPNKEIAFVYEKEILNKNNQSNAAIDIRQAIFLNDPKKLQTVLEKFLIDSISYLDGGNEGFYHGLMLGLCAVFSNQYQILSNRESGFGRFDIGLIPKQKRLPAFLFEFKYTKDRGKDLEILADEALDQIEDKKYDSFAKEAGISDIIKIGIAFCGKKAVVKTFSQ